MTEISKANKVLVEAWRFFVERFPKGIMEESDGWVGALGQVPLSFFNMFFLVAPVGSTESLDHHLAGVVRRAEHLDQPWFLALCDAWTPPDRDRVCLNLGLVPALRLYGMVAERLSPPGRELPRLTYRRTHGRETAGLMAQINGAAYGMPEEAVSSISLPELWDESTHAYIGYEGAEPVTCAATMPVENLLYVSWVATLPGHQKRGFAEAVMRKSLAEAEKATGLGNTLLHATDAGRPLYAAMGYRETSEFSLYSPALQEH